MRSYRPYIEHLNKLIDTVVDSPVDARKVRSVVSALNGQASSALRQLVSREQLRRDGVFFSSHKLARLACQTLGKTLTSQSRVIDPACGSGDLLLACLHHMPIKKTLDATLKAWGQAVSGRDIHGEFVHASRFRLALTALHSHSYPDGVDPRKLRQAFPDVTTQCGLSDVDALQSATHILTNPPFGLTLAPKSCGWASGKVNAAALYFDQYVKAARQGTHIIGILPDVLRSGSRYSRWRKVIAEAATVRRVELYGQFDAWTDVDVFILEVKKRNGSEQKSDACRSMDWLTSPSMLDHERVSENFDIRVGPVVDYRDPHLGQWFPYIQSRDLPKWSTIRRIDKRRRFSGTVVLPPFVAIKRTSRPGDEYRAIGTIIASDGPVAVENHLITMSPKDGSLKSCRRLLNSLRHTKTTEWLDRRIRCRHLTVSALADLPWMG